MALPAPRRVFFDFTMCNPPFYSSAAEIADSALMKEEGPRAVCTAGEKEMITSGGEVKFIGRMVEESVQIEGHQLRCFSPFISDDAC